jgi:hypothetical protein
LVKEFYSSDEVSNQKPGMKGFKSVKTDENSQIHMQKKFALGNLK